MSATAAASNTMPAVRWQPLCRRADLVAFSGVVAWLETSAAQVALFYLPGHTPELYALDHFDPFSNAYVIGRGIVGDLDGAPVIASPLYKQHFRLSDGLCLEDENVRLRTWPVRFDGDRVVIEA
ncbi:MULTISPECIES: nitrite reductase small subunit NirD [unclassified Halomonas]|uniref:nitrite reductase small subunit NirD n=1 Tax=unclassified Halomonas TaxID=2609666 RepID=UPI00209FFC32|nr:MULTISPECIES: nitrite reductase small subunit NirD [unclassified Halomonas]MCP1312866.1 nitrite reductase small subunit NirD [Halomonas sp. 707D7]MCP1327657.1 nitrite reductase small subunit NirD [Halomonas sp. 707D4]